jgi:hypothetical protein
MSSFRESVTSVEAPIRGLEVLEDFISAEEEQSLLSFLYSPKCKWRIRPQS